jgi:thiol-disulfide isomerase/thioredoxin
MERLTLKLFIICLSIINYFPLIAQIDTVYSFTNWENQVPYEEITQEIERLKEVFENDTIDHIIRFKTTHEEFLRDTLMKYGTIHIIDASLLSEEEKIAARLNQKMPSFNFLDINGIEIASESFKNKVIYINFWFTRCPPCLVEMPYLNQIKNDYKDQNIEFISMAPEEKSQLEKFLLNYDFQFRYIPDADLFLKKFGVGFPKNILIDKNGIIRYIGDGVVSNLDDNDFEAAEIQNQVNWDQLRIQIDKLLEE